MCSAYWWLELIKYFFLKNTIHIMIHRRCVNDDTEELKILHAHILRGCIFVKCHMCLPTSRT